VLSSLKRATVETLSITPRKDGKVEIVLRVLADHERLVDCSAQFIRAGCESFRLWDIFKTIAPNIEDDVLRSQEASNISPAVPTVYGESGVDADAPVHGLNFSHLRTEVRPANDDAMNETRLPFNRHDIFSSLQRIEAQLINIGESMCDHDHEVRNGLVTVKLIAAKLKTEEQIATALSEAEVA
jgi:hypothetical protein